jgi:hypothetical protein
MATEEMIRDIVRKLDAHIVETRQSRITTKQSIDCLRDSFQEFEAEYGPMLKASVKRTKFWDGVKDRTIERGVVYGLGVAALAMLAGTVMVGVKHLKGLLGLL